MKVLPVDMLGEDFSLQEFTPREQLVHALRQARDEIAALKEEVDKLCAPPSTYGVYLSAHHDDTVDVLAQGRKVRVRLHPAIKAEALRPGQELVLNEAIQGDVVVLKNRLDHERAVVTLRADGEKIAVIADPLRSLRLKPGDQLLMDPKSGYVLERLPKTEMQDLALEALLFKDFASGAMIESVVRRAKKLALKRYIGGAAKGLTTDDLLAPNTTNPDDWAKIAGKKGERIAYVKSLVGQASQPQRSVENVVNTGQYL